MADEEVLSCTLINIAWKSKSAKTALKMVSDDLLYAERQGLYIILAAESLDGELFMHLCLSNTKQGKLSYLKSPPIDS